MQLKNYRARHPQETYELIKPLLSSFGITRLANITGLDNVGIPVYLAMRPNSRSLSLSQGKGIDSISAKVSALMEAIEGFHAETIESPLFRGSLNNMTALGMQTVDCNALPRLNNSHLDFNKETFWMEGIEIIKGESIHVPYEIVHTDYRISKPSSLDCFPIGSNGLSSGNTLKEAAVHGLCELIERDSYSCWLVSGTSAQDHTKVDPDTIDCPHARELLARFSRAGVLVGIWNITSDLNVPTFLARILNKEGPPACPIRPASGFGCHPDKRIALLRALTEAAQSRLTFIAGGRDDLRASHYRSYLSDSEHEKWYQSVANKPVCEDFKNIPAASFEESDDLYFHLIKILNAANFEKVIQIDLSKSDTGISIVKMIVPGLEGAESYKVVEPGFRAKRKIEQVKNIHA